ncbi:hypothetical protein ACNS7O_18950 (plasmid) [Haloferacaceae archaeon DSL9]
MPTVLGTPTAGCLVEPTAMSTNASDRLDSAEQTIIIASDDGVILDETTRIDWQGPFTERDAYGHKTGATYVRCPHCGIEVLESAKAHASHRPACTESESGDGR